MQSTPSAETTESPIPGLIPDPVSLHDETAPPSPKMESRRHWAGRPLAKLLSVIRGDKYMADAYPLAAPVGSPPKER
jgi:hypothetical protein